MLDRLKIRVIDAVEIIRNEGSTELWRRIRDKLRRSAIGLPKETALAVSIIPSDSTRPSDIASNRGRILVIDAHIPMPDCDSGSQRMFAILRIIRSLGYEVTFIAANCEYKEPYVSALEQSGIEVWYAPHVSSLRSFLKVYGKRYDVIWISRAQVARKYLKLARRVSPYAMIIFDTVELQFLRKYRFAAVSNNRMLKVGAAALKKLELDLASEADATVVVSAVEKEILEEHLEGKLVEVVSNVHEGCDALKGWKDRSGIIFIGCFRHPPNVDAVCYYVNEILPEIKKILPDVMTYFVGSDPPGRIRALASKDVVVTGYVPDITGYLDQTRVSVVPLRYGAGVKGKINTAMSNGIPVVTTSVGAEGMYLVDGISALISDDPKTFARAVIRVYTERKLWEKLSLNGLANVRDHFSIDTAKRTLEAFI